MAPTTTTNLPPLETDEQKSTIGKMIRWCMTNPLVVFLLVVFIVGWGISVAPFDWNADPLPRKPVPVDAIPDIGENQQIIFTQWMGRSPQDVEDQISYPMTVALQGIQNVKTIRSYSMFGFSMIYMIFDEGMDFYDARTRILEKLNSLQPGKDYPEGTRPQLGPDSTALGQIFWYTLEGRDPEGKPAGGWDLEELRTIQDWYVRYSLMSAGGVSEVASIGGYVREYQVDVDPDAMRAFGVTIGEVFTAVKGANIDVGAKTIELNSVEYFVRGIGFIKNVADIEKSVIKVKDNVPVLVSHVATVSLGPALRRGALDKGGAEAVGGVVVSRYGDNPLAVIKNVKEMIKKIAPGLKKKVLVDTDKTTPDEIRRYAKTHGFDAYEGDELNQAAWLEHLGTIPTVEIPADRKSEAEQYAKDHGFKPFVDRKVNRIAWIEHLKSIPQSERPGWATLGEDWPHWVNTSQVTVIPFYDRTGLIHETLGTLESALSEEILITFIVVILMVVHLRSSILIGGMLPLTVLLCFIGMKAFGVDANVVALSGIAIAIGTIVDMGIVICENILRHLDEAPPDEPRLEVVHRAASEVGSAILTAVATTIVSFLPVFTMIGAEGKLFKPLAFTKSFALLASIIIALTILPPAAHLVFCGKLSGKKVRRFVQIGLILAAGLLSGYALANGSGLLIGTSLGLLAMTVYGLVKDRLPAKVRKYAPWCANGAVVLLVGVLLAMHWEPLGPERGLTRNFIFVGGLLGILLGFFKLFQRLYPRMLHACLNHKVVFLSIVVLIFALGMTAWLGSETVFSPVPAAAEKLGFDADDVRESDYWLGAKERFPGLGKQFMPDLDEGSYLYMPTTMTHASIGEAIDVLAKQDSAFQDIPEIESVVGKIGRAETPLDPAPISMVETVINYKSEYVTDADGRRINFKYDEETDAYPRKNGELIPDAEGKPFRQWRDHIRKPNDIWDEIVKAGEIPGSTSAPKLQPIAARIVMLQSGMRAPMGVKIYGPDLKTIEDFGIKIEALLKKVPGVQKAAVLADRIIGKPYLEIVPDRDALSRYGVKIRQFQDVVEVAIGGRTVTHTVEGRERFPVRVRYQRELRDSREMIRRILVPGKDGTQIPLEQLASIKYVPGPQVIKSEDTFKVGYVLFDKQADQAEVDVVERAQAYLAAAEESGELVRPAGVNYKFAGNYENQIRSQKTLAVVLPGALFAIFLILYLQFRSVTTTLLIFTGIFVAWSGGFILLWAYGQSWFLNFSVFGVEMRELFQVQTINMTVAVWVGFLALFGIATDDGVVMGTYLEQSFRKTTPDTVQEVRQAVVVAGSRRIRACLMTTATTILALIPVLTATGRGSDIMVPMAIPSVGGMLIEVLTMFVVPVLFCLVQEVRLLAAAETDTTIPPSATV